MAAMIQKEQDGAADTQNPPADLLAEATDGAVQSDDVEAAMAAMLEGEPDAAPPPVEPQPAQASPPSAPNAPQQTPPAPPVEPFNAPQFDAATPAGAFGDISLLDDVDLDVRIELGRTEMYIEDVLRLGPGSVVELDKLAGDPVDILVNDRLVARGEVLVLNDNFCVRINDIVSQVPEEEEA
ncbi:MAG: flagellar motor switch protein FliN [Planctomycetota bacterium]|nr:MAG: flagellar motor switch protein FliN [Planctomycetota bacterium]